MKLTLKIVLELEKVYRKLGHKSSQIETKLDRN